MAGARLAVSTGYFFLLGGTPVTAAVTGVTEYRKETSDPATLAGPLTLAGPPTRPSAFQEHGFTDLTGTEPTLGD